MTVPAHASSTAWDQAGRAAAPQFETAMRGYERRQVDEYLSAQASQMARLKAELAESRRNCNAALARAEAADAAVRELRSRTTPEPEVREEGFGFRAEKLLRLAEQEASEVRAIAGRESAAIVDQARKDAEQHRHEVEQTLISRSSMLEQQAAHRTAELQEREQQIADQLAAAREQTEQVHAAAARAAEQLRHDSESAAAETLARAEKQAQRQREQAEQEIERLNSLQAGVRSELARLAEVLTAELAGEGRPSRSGESRPEPQPRPSRDGAVAR